MFNRIAILCLISVLICHQALATATGEMLHDTSSPQAKHSIDGEDSGHKEPPADHQHQDPPVEITVKEKLGGRVPLDLQFTDETGVQVTLAELIDKPTIIVPIYYRCPNVCNFLQAGIARVLPEVELKPGEEYQVLSISFDETETPQLAKGSKGTYFTAMGQPFPDTGWRFLTGDIDNINRLLKSIGYGVQRKGVDFLHPVAVVAVGKEGVISRYLYGTTFLPKDITLALIEASEGRVGTAIQRALSVCFSYDPQGRRYVFNLLQVAGTVVLLTAGGLLGFLLLTGRRKPVPKRKVDPPDEKQIDE